MDTQKDLQQDVFRLIDLVTDRMTKCFNETHASQMDFPQQGNQQGNQTRLERCVNALAMAQSADRYIQEMIRTIKRLVEEYEEMCQAENS